MRVPRRGRSRRPRRGGDGGPRLRYVEEPEARGTAGAIRFAERFLDERFLALNGDVLTDLDLTALMDLHEQRGATATLALHPVDDPSAYGLVRRKEDGEIVEFLEKPDPKQIDTDEINAGAYVLERSVLDLIPSDREVSIEREVFPSWWARACGLRLPGYWMDIGTPSDTWRRAGTSSSAGSRPRSESASETAAC